MGPRQARVRRFLSPGPDQRVSLKKLESSSRRLSTRSRDIVPDFCHPENHCRPRHIDETHAALWHETTPRPDRRHLRATDSGPHFQNSENRATHPIYQLDRRRCLINEQHLDTPNIERHQRLKFRIVKGLPSQETQPP